MPELDYEKVTATAAFLLANFGPSALLQASVCGYEALFAKDVELCRFWRQVMRHLESTHGLPQSE